MQNNSKLGLTREYFFFPLIVSQREKLCAQGIPRTRKGWVRVEEQGGAQVLSRSRLPDLLPFESWQALGRPTPTASAALVRAWSQVLCVLWEVGPLDSQLHWSGAKAKGLCSTKLPEVEGHVMGLCRRAYGWPRISVIFFTKKSDFAASQVTALEEVAPACIFTMSPSIAMCCHTGELPVPLSCPRTFAHLVLSACHMLASLPTKLALVYILGISSNVTLSRKSSWLLSAR